MIFRKEGLCDSSTHHIDKKNSAAREIRASVYAHFNINLAVCRAGFRRNAFQETGRQKAHAAFLNRSSAKLANHASLNEAVSNHFDYSAALGTS